MSTSSHVDGPVQDRLVGTLVAAFDEDPLYRWLFPDPLVRPGALRATMELILRLAAERGAVQHARGGRAVAVWTGPGTDLLEDPAVFIDLLRRWAPDRVDQALAGMAECEQHRPPSPVRVLHLLAVHPSAQGRGMASALVQPVLDRCDRDGVACYLESSHERNLTFYRRCGFQVLGEVVVAGDGPVMRPMLRDLPAQRRGRRVPSVR